MNFICIVSGYVVSVHPARIILAKLPLLLTPLTYIPVGKDAKIAKLKLIVIKSIQKFFLGDLCAFAREIMVFTGGYWQPLTGMHCATAIHLLIR